MKRALERLIRLLLWVTPKATRQRYGCEISGTVTERVGKVRRTSGLVPALRLGACESFGILAAGVTLRFNGARHALAALGRSLRRSPAARTDVVFHDLRLAVRGLMHQPAFTGVAVVTLALGIGASIAIFSIFYAVVLHPLPFANPERLVALWAKNAERGWHQAQVAAANYLDWRCEAQTFVDMAAYNDWLDERILVFDGEPSIVEGVEVTGNLFHVLGVSPEEGRVFDDAQTWAGAEPAVVLGHRFWMRRFGGDVSIIGGLLALDGVSHRVLGVMPEQFAYPFADADLWLPMAWKPEYRDQVWFRRAHGLRVVGRLEDGVSLEEAHAELAAIAARLEKAYPETNTMMGNGVTPLQDWIVGDATRPLQILMAAVGFVLLIACANVSNMLLARGSNRSNETRIRSALGAAQRRLVFESLLESLLLAATGGTLGMILGIAALEPLLGMSPESLPRIEELRIDGAVVLFAVAVSMASALFFGGFPAWRRASVDPTEGLSNRGFSRTHRFATLLVAVEVALTLPLVVGAGLMVRTLSHLSEVEPGFVSENVLVARVALPATRYDGDDSISRFYRELVDSLGSIAGVDSAALSSRLPFRSQRWSSDFTAEGWDPDHLGIGVRHDEITPGLFRTMGVPLLGGRDFDWTDDMGAPPVVIINEALAQKYFPGEDPVGRRVVFDRVPDADSVWRMVVGVVGNIRRESLGVEEEPSFYAPVLQDPTRQMRLLIRTAENPAALTSVVRETVRALDPTLPLFGVTTLEAVVASSVDRERYLLTLLSIAAIVALVLASVGIFGVLFYTTSRRVREIGIRMALGARGRSVIVLVLRTGMQPVVLGVVAGVFAAAFLARAMSGFLFEVDPGDPLTFAGVVAIVLTVSLAACAIPARWATRVEAASALRSE